jgi:hypothetical protein
MIEAVSLAVEQPFFARLVSPLRATPLRGVYAAGGRSAFLNPDACGHSLVAVL